VTRQYQGHSQKDPGYEGAREEGNIETKIAQTWHMSHKTILDFSPLMHFFHDLSISPARMIPYNSQNNDALIKELKFALKSVRE
jgi:hypothetical protein